MEPEATAREKYSAAGGFDMDSFEAFGFFPVIVKTLRVAAANTWASYAMAERLIARAEKVMGVNITFPFSSKSPGLCGLPTCT